MLAFSLGWGASIGAGGSCLGCPVVIGSGEILECKGFSEVCRGKSLCRHWLCESLVILRFCDHEMLKLEYLVFPESSAHWGEIQGVEILYSNVFRYRKTIS